jgi:leucyl-tRNA synthetase
MVAEARLDLGAVGGAQPNHMDPAVEAVHQAVHKTIDATTSDLDRFHFNRAVARIRELTNELDKLEATMAGAGWVMREGLEAIVRLIGPMTPHVAEDLWQRLGHQALLAETAWPEAEAALLTDETVTVAVQVNGKLRGTIELGVDADKETAESTALNDPAIVRALAGKTPRRVIVVPNRIVNVVI